MPRLRRKMRRITKNEMQKLFKPKFYKEIKRDDKAQLPLIIESLMIAISFPFTVITELKVITQNSSSVGGPDLVDIKTRLNPYIF